MRQLTADAGILCNNSEVAVGVNEAMAQSRTVRSHTSRLRLIHVELERTSFYRRSVVGDAQLVFANLSRSERYVHRSVLVIDNSWLHHTPRRRRYLRCITIHRVAQLK